MTNTYRPQLSMTNLTIDNLLNHHSVRSYQDRPVDDDALQAILWAALSTATASNQNGWSVIVVRDPQHKSALADLTLSNPFINQAPLFLVWVADLSRSARLSAIHGSPTEVFDYQEAILTSAIDVGIAAQNAVVAAESLGLGTCYIGGIRSRLEAVSQVLNLPDHSFPVLGMTIGWAGQGDQAGTKPRLPLSAVSFDEVYDPVSADAGIAVLESQTAEYFEGQGYGKVSWVNKSLSRWKSGDSLDGRQHNRAAIAARGLAGK